MEENGEPRKFTLVSNDSDDRLLKLLSAQALKLQAEASFSCWTKPKCYF